MGNPALPGKKLADFSKAMQICALYTMFECEREGGYAFMGETHDFWECVFVEYGKICVSADERIYNMKKGEMIFHKPMEFHKYHVEKGANARLFIFSFTLTGKLSGTFENKVVSLSKEQLCMMQSIIDFVQKKKDEARDLKDEYSGILDVLFSNELHTHMLINSIYVLFLSICESSIGTNAQSETHGALIYRQAVEYMNENLDKNLSVCEIAEKCCVSTTGLKKIFSEYAGIGIHTFYLKLKIKKATSLLAGGVTTSEIAQSLGFSSQGYFSEAFKRETGLSPKEYRKKCSDITHY